PARSRPDRRSRWRSSVSWRDSIIRRLRLFIALLLALPCAAAAQPAGWPSRPVRIIATSPPGGSVDLLARIAADEFTRAFGRPFIVENRPGANGNIGAELIAKAPADGQLLLVAPPGPFSINAHLMAAMPFDPGDLAPVALLGIAPLL